jgi:hypothetical protein
MLKALDASARSSGGGGVMSTITAPGDHVVEIAVVELVALSRALCEAIDLVGAIADSPTEVDRIEAARVARKMMIRTCTRLNGMMRFDAVGVPGA